MCEICGIIDFSRKNIAFDTLLQMWRASAPLGSGFSYINFGVALACERDERISAIHRATASENRILMLGENKCNFSANELLYIYENEDLSYLRITTRGICFALLDEKKKLFALSCGSDPLFCSDKDGKIIFASKKEALGHYSPELPFIATTISPNGFVIYSKT